MYNPEKLRGQIIHESLGDLPFESPVLCKKSIHLLWSPRGGEETNGPVPLSGGAVLPPLGLSVTHFSLGMDQEEWLFALD